MLFYSCRDIFISFVFFQATLSDSDDDVCDAPIADTCFSDVQDDLRFIFESDFQGRNESALGDLCDAWRDSLQCTRDIVDTTCSNVEGADRFDVWNDGLTRGVDLLCNNGMTNLKVVASTIHCWNMSKFLYCVENKTELISVEDLLKTSLSGDGCDVIRYAFDDCHLEATDFRCPVFEVVRSTVESILIELFKEVDCEENLKPTPMMINCSNFNRILFYSFIVSTVLPLLIN